MDIFGIISSAKLVQDEVNSVFGPPTEGLHASTQMVILKSLVNGTRGYIEKIANQVNGAYESGWYDACAVMVRRLLETLIIEAFEKHKLDQKIKNNSGDFLYFGDLISRALAEPSWNLSRNCKQALPRLKDIGDKSAHSRRFIAHKGDIEPRLADIRLVVQEFIFLAGLK